VARFPARQTPLNSRSDSSVNVALHASFSAANDVRSDNPVEKIFTFVSFYDGF